MRLVIAGGRTFDNLELMTERLDFLIAKDDEPVTVISGTARGADSTGEQYAKQRGFAVERMPAQWDKYGRSAGYKRNQQMADTATHVVVFWDGESRGSKHMIDIAKAKGLPLRIVRYTYHQGKVYLDAKEGVRHE